jgi:formate hydrogenlyase subunit 6/NADH:ubiquinone oxidoreductase subunit I
MRIDKTAASYLLLELLRGMATTLRYMFKQKATLNLTTHTRSHRRVHGSAGNMRSDAIRTAKSGVSPASCVKPFVHPSVLLLNRSLGRTARVAQRDMTLI